MLSRIILTACSFCPPVLFEFEMSQRVEVLGHHGLALAHLGRFFEAHRRLNEAAALRSKLERKTDIIDLAILRLRRAEVHLLEANQVKSIQSLSKTAASLYDEIAGGKTPGPGQKAPEPAQKCEVLKHKVAAAIARLKELYADSAYDLEVSVSWLIANLHHLFKEPCFHKVLAPFKPQTRVHDTVEQLVSIYGFHDSQQYQRMVSAKVDDAWAAIESAELLLAGQSRASRAWGRLCALKLQILAFHPPNNLFRTLATRRQVQIDEDLRHFLRLGFAVWPDDPFRRIRLADYFLSAWEGVQINSAKGGNCVFSVHDISMIRSEVFDNFAYEVNLGSIEGECPPKYFYLKKYADALRKRLAEYP
jgi:hypothetical protein